MGSEGGGAGAEAAVTRPLRPGVVVRPVRPGTARGWFRRAEAGAAGQPLIAPCMIPPTICLPNSRKAMSSGRVPRSAPAMITAWSGT